MHVGLVVEKAAQDQILEDPVTEDHITGDENTFESLDPVLEVGQGKVTRVAKNVTQNPQAKWPRLPKLRCIKGQLQPRVTLTKSTRCDYITIKKIESFLDQLDVQVGKNPRRGRPLGSKDSKVFAKRGRPKKQKS